ncbi:MAG: prephenate dehydrogenase/arogenate dehydrogenase family protein [Myxococcales bacterium]
MRITFLGAGRMGSWLARKLAAAGHEVAAYDTEPRRVGALATDGVRPLDSLEALAGTSPQLLVNAVNLAGTVAAFRSVAPLLDPGCALADLASVKADIAAYYRGCGRRFASVHPMFGPTFADLQRSELSQENAILIQESDPETVGVFRALFERLGLRLFQYSFDEHDQMMAYSLTTPFASSLVFAACIDDTVVPGTSFARHLRTARGLLSEDDELLTEILFNPRSLAQLAAIRSRLELLERVIRDRDGEELRAFLRRLRGNLA